MALSESMALVPQGSIGAYIQSVNQIPMLTAEEEQELGERLHEEGDLSAARRLVMSHLRFVVHVAKSYMGYGLPQSDLIQEGNIGLMKAVKRFDPSFGVRLVSFAVHWIKAEIHEFVLRNWRIVKVATTKAQRKLFFNLRKSKKRLGWFSEEEINNVANELGVSAKEVMDMEGRLSAQDPTFDAPSDSSDDEQAFAPAHYLEDKSTNVAALVENSNWQVAASKRLSAALATLDERSQNIIKCRWLNEEKSTLHELAALYEVSAERIRQLENNALKKLKNCMEA